MKMTLQEWIDSKPMLFNDINSSILAYEKLTTQECNTLLRTIMMYIRREMKE